jgi:hypothetical protein
MRRRNMLATALGACLTLAGCKRRRKVRVEQTEEDGASLASVIHAGNPGVAPQFVKGFYPIEEKSWRWTMGQFAVNLRPPRNAATTGATLHFKFTLPEAVLSKLKTVSISANVNGISLPPETYTQAGVFDYSRDVPASALTGDSVKVEFTMDKFIPAGEVEQRELGVIATSVGFEAK